MYRVALRAEVGRACRRAERVTSRHRRGCSTSVGVAIGVLRAEQAQRRAGVVGGEESGSGAVLGGVPVGAHHERAAVGVPELHCNIRGAEAEFEQMCSAECRSS
jgi:hypothetical protein